MRRLLPLLLLLTVTPLSAQVQSLSSVSPFQQMKARTLLAEQLPCLGCHELDGSGGRSAPSLTGVGARRGAAYVRAIIDDPQGVVPGAAMPRALMPRSTRDVVVAFLTRDARDPDSATSLPAKRAVPEQRTDGPVLYGKWCSTCHGVRGGGDGPNAKYLTVKPAIHASAAQMSLRSDDALFDAIAGGGVVMGKSALMPAFGATLSAAEIRALVAYIRTLCACSAPVWSRDGTPR